ncbi:MAG: hypothetical protein K2X47_11745 [Bdellovibrionales bacterium]|nr:hypothetical protein [Bdellovibrionales bacterium]
MKSLNACSLLLTFLLTTTAFGFSYEEKWKRYPRPDEILSALADSFPLALEGSLATDCIALSAENRGFLGDSKPVDGKPEVKAPNLSFVQWVSKCAAQYVSEDVRKRYELLGTGTKPDIFEFYTGHAPGLSSLDQWSEVTGELQLQIIKQTVTQILGPPRFVTAKTGQESSVFYAKIRETLNRAQTNSTFYSSIPSALRSGSTFNVLTGIRIIAYSTFMHIDYVLMN